MSVQDIIRTQKRGRRLRCNITGVWFYEDEMVRDKERDGYVHKDMVIYPDTEVAPVNRSNKGFWL